MGVTGASLTGGRRQNGRERIENDFYATDPKSVYALFENFLFKKINRVLEPCVGMGHIANVVKKYADTVDTIDIVDRGYPNTVVNDYLTHDFGSVKYDAVITNPPFKLAKEFIFKSLTLVEEGGVVAMFLKISFLESEERKPFFLNTPLKYVYVFSKRQQPLRNGEPFDEKGKRWAGTICFAWFIWEKGYVGDPMIRWI